MIPAPMRDASGSYLNFLSLRFGSGERNCGMEWIGDPMYTLDIARSKRSELSCNIQLPNYGALVY